jgi:carbon-monoxide dehydrogenase small subunit
MSASATTGLRTVELTVNGSLVRVEVEPRRLLADVLREELELRGVHLGCEHGICGACTILLNAEPARSCLMLAVQADGRDVTTVEALANGPELHPLQRAFQERHGLQCGFCTPGFLLTSLYLLKEGVDLEDEGKLREALSGNLCRCTGYQNIIDAVRRGAALLSQGDTQ